MKKVPITAADGKVAGGCRVDASFNIYPVCWVEFYLFNLLLIINYL